MADQSVDDVLKELSENAPKSENVEDVLANLGTYSPKPEESSVGSEYWKTLKQGVAKAARGTELLARGAAPSVAGTLTGFELGGAPGALVGSVAIPFGDTLNSIINRVAGTNLRMPSEVISTNLAKAGLKEPTTEAGRVVEAAGGGLGGAASELSTMYNLARAGSTGLLPEISKEMTQNAGRQVVGATAGGAGGQYAEEETGSPFAGLLASMGISSATGLTGLKKAKGAPSHEDLVLESKNLYDKANQSGVQFDNSKFSNKMTDLKTDLRKEGFTSAAYPGIESVLNEAIDVKNPKDFTELQALRKMIQGQQKSNDPETRRLASILKDHFDDYVLNAPSSDLTAGTKQGLQDWQDARKSYSKLKKAEIFDDMLSNAEVEGITKFTQAGTENSLAKQLRQLSLNDKRMRTFTKEEQDAIREAAKGGTVQNMLRFYGKFAPTGPVSSIFSGGAAAYEPMIGVPFAAGATASRMGATAMRKNAVENLAAQMRLGQKPELSSPLQAVPLNTLQGIMAAPSQLNTNYLRNLINQGQ